VGVSKDYDQRGEVESTYVSGGFPWYLISIRIKSTAVPSSIFLVSARSSHHPAVHNESVIVGLRDGEKSTSIELSPSPSPPSSPLP